MGVFSGTAMVAGLMIGSGIFSTPGSIWELAGSPGMAMVLWIVGGIITYCGTFCYIELGTMLPKSGGEQAYLQQAFRKPKALFAFLFCIIMIVCIRPGSAAADSTVFGKYLMYSIFGEQSTLADGFVKSHYDLFLRLMGVFCISSITLINIFSVKWSIRVHDILTTIKVLVLLLISVSGIVVLSGGTKVPYTNNWSNPFAGSKIDANSYAKALFSVFWAYDGWNNLNYSVGELKNPRRNLPIAAGLGVTIVTILYLMANVAYITVVPATVAFTSHELLAGNFGEIVFGRVFGHIILPILIALSTYGAVSAMVFSMSRVMFVAAREGYLPFSSVFGKLHSTLKTPIYALLFNWCWTMVMLLGPPPGEAFEFLVDFISYPAWFFYGISVVGLLWMRKTQPELERPFKVWWPLAVLFILCAVFLCVFPFFPPTDGEPLVSPGGIPYYLSSLLGLISIVLPIPLWYIMVIHRGNTGQALRRLSAIKL
jgi:amino acid transporter